MPQAETSAIAPLKYKLRIDRMQLTTTLKEIVSQNCHKSEFWYNNRLAHLEGFSKSLILHDLCLVGREGIEPSTY